MREKDYRPAEGMEGAPYFDGLLLPVEVTTPKGTFEVQATLMPEMPQSNVSGPSDQEPVPELLITGRHIEPRITANGILKGILHGAPKDTGVEIRIREDVTVVPTAPGRKGKVLKLFALGLPNEAQALEAEYKPAESTETEYPVNNS